MGQFFKLIAVAVSMLGALLLSALVVFILEFGVVLIVVIILNAAGMMPSIPHRYEVLAIGLMGAFAVCVPGIGWVRYVLLAAREG
jgi:hypothetical protein